MDAAGERQKKSWQSFANKMVKKKKTGVVRKMIWISSLISFLRQRARFSRRRKETKEWWALELVESVILIWQRIQAKLGTVDAPCCLIFMKILGITLDIWRQTVAESRIQKYSRIFKLIERRVKNRLSSCVLSHSEAAHRKLKILYQILFHKIGIYEQNTRS